MTSGQEQDPHRSLRPDTTHSSRATTRSQPASAPGLSLVACRPRRLLQNRLCTIWRTVRRRPLVKAWPARWPANHPHYTPTDASWINQVKSRFGLITRQAVRLGSFSSVKELTRKINACVEQYIAQASAFTWVASAESILARIERVSSLNSWTQHWVGLVGDQGRCAFTLEGNSNPGLIPMRPEPVKHLASVTTTASSYPEALFGSARAQFQSPGWQPRRRCPITTEAHSRSLRGSAGPDQTRTLSRKRDGRARCPTTILSSIRLARSRRTVPPWSGTQS